FGGKIYNVNARGKYLEVNLGHEFKYNEIKEGAKVYLNSDDALSKELHKTYQDRELKKRIPLFLKIQGKVGAMMQVQARDEGGNEVILKSSEEMQPATKAPVTQEKLMEVFGGLS